MPVAIDSDRARLYVFELHPELRPNLRAPFDQPAAVLDGRLEDLNGLGDWLGGDPSADQADILRQAWRCSPDGAFRRLKGRFAGIVVDPASWRVAAFRSPVAGRALYYHLDQRRLVLASEPWPLLALDVDAGFDESWLSYYFCLRTPPASQSAFARVSELLPGELLECTADAWSLKRYPPAFDAVDKAVYRDDAACAGRFRELLSSAVAQATDGGGPFAIMQSSGVDSGSFAGVVARDRGLRGHLVSTYSWTLKDFPDVDESAQIRDLTARIGLPNTMVAGDSCWPPETADEWPLCPNTPVSNPFRVLKARLYERAREDGCAQILNGNAGDLLYPGPGRLLWEALIDWRPGLFLTELQAIARRWGFRGLPASPALRGFARSALNRRPRVRVPAHLTDFARGRIDPDAWWPPEAVRYPRADHYKELLGLDFARSVDDESYFINAHGMEWVEPYLNHDLVGFMLGIPAWQCYRRGQDKHVAREARRGLIPEAVRIQPRVGLLGDIFRTGFYRSMPWIAALLRATGAEWPRYVRREYVEGALQKSSMSDSEMMHLWSCAAFEMWLDRYFR